MFKRLCKQNQIAKFNTLWGKLDKNTRGHVEEKSKKLPKADESPPKRLSPLGELDPPGLTRRSSCNIKCFSHWIEAEPREKWVLLYDIGGARFGVMTTNIAEVYNWVIRGLKGMPLVAIVEGVLYGIVGYYQKMHAVVVLHCTSIQTPY
uniref:Uncharacterized protein n=1 Tax=Arundo donax TaxID=35708 RepID=A0A0A9HEJ7_ARUDO